eukprot:jgi/Hompol1/2021/HPOL_002805-RA
MTLILKAAAADKQAVISEFVAAVDYYATWCGPCKVISPKFHAFAEQYSSIKFLQVDVDEAADIAEWASIRAMPTFQLYVNEELVDSLVGADPNKLEAIIKKAA